MYADLQKRGQYSADKCTDITPLKWVCKAKVPNHVTCGRRQPPVHWACLSLSLWPLSYSNHVGFYLKLMMFSPLWLLNLCINVVIINMEQITSHNDFQWPTGACRSCNVMSTQLSQQFFKIRVFVVTVPPLDPTFQPAWCPGLWTKEDTVQAVSYFTEQPIRLQHNC